MTAFLDAHPWLVFAAGLIFYVSLWLLLVACAVRRESHRRDSLAHPPGRVEGTPRRAAGASPLQAPASADGMSAWDAEADQGRGWWPR